MEAFKNVTMTKEELLTELKIHQKADNFIRGSYSKKDGDSFKGCAVYVVLESLIRKKNITNISKGQHSAYPEHFGIPQWLAKIEDLFFEGMSKERSKEWPVEFISAINTGSDLNKILNPFLIIICESVLNDFDHIKHPTIKLKIDNVISALKDKNTTRKCFYNLRLAAAAAAAAASSYTASYAAAAAAAAYYAASSDAAASAAAYYAAASYAAASRDNSAAARVKKYEFLSNKLIELIKGCK